VRSADGAAGAVVDVSEAVVAPADDPIADGDRDRAVSDVLPERVLLAAVLARGLVEARARGVVGGRSAPRRRRRARRRPAPILQRDRLGGAFIARGMHGDAVVLLRPAQVRARVETHTAC
jgi:hypothetical protein